MKKFAVILIALVLFSSPAIAQEFSDGFMGSGERQWNVAFYVWGTGLQGDIGVGPFQVPVDVSFSDVLDDLDFALFGHVDWHSRSNNLGFFTDLSYLKLSSSQNRPAGTLATKLEATWWEAALSYNLATHESPFDIFLGFRWWDVDASMRFDATGGQLPPALFPPDGVNVAGGDDWGDLMFGGRWAPRIGGKWWLILRADYATANSDTFNIAGNLLWRVGHSTSLIFGWRYMDMDYTTGSGVNRRVLDVEFNGPVAALNFTF